MNSPLPTAVENTIPVLAVSNLQDSVRFYDLWLQFKVDWGADSHTPEIASVPRDGHAIMLQVLQPPTPGCVWIGMTDIRPVWWHIRSLSERSPDECPIVQYPTNRPWALEMKIRDFDGNVLWFGSEPISEVGYRKELSGTELDPC